MILTQSFVIPVNIRVTDANDNAPQFLQAPYVLNISEVPNNQKSTILRNKIILFGTGDSGGDESSAGHQGAGR
jgi:hypothetical protein